MFEGASQVWLPESLPPMLAVVIDAEEEFDWSAGVHRNSTAVTAIRNIDRLQKVFDDYGVRPVYVMDYPIASKPDGRAALKPIVDDGRAVLGAQLHPWVNPPHLENVSQFNSYQGNLSHELERQKLAILKQTIEENFGVSPVIHKAGRYGAGANTPVILDELGFEIDISAVPGYDWGADGGPDYSRLNQNMFWFGPGDAILGVPNTGGFIGALRKHGPALHSATRGARPLWSLCNRVLSRTRLLERILLSPEGHSLEKMIRLTDTLFGWGYRVFTFSLHSPTIKPGGTPYTSSEHDVQVFLDKCRRYLDYFFGRLAGQCLTPLELRSLALEYSKNSQCVDTHSA